MQQHAVDAVADLLKWE